MQGRVSQYLIIQDKYSHRNWFSQNFWGVGRNLIFLCAWIEIKCVYFYVTLYEIRIIRDALYQHFVGDWDFSTCLLHYTASHPRRFQSQYSLPQAPSFVIFAVFLFQASSLSLGNRYALPASPTCTSFTVGCRPPVFGCWLKHGRAYRVGWHSSNALHSYSEGSWFGRQLGHRLSWLFCVVFISLPREMSGSTSR